MPLYSYRCLECGAEFEKLISYTHSLQMECPECGSEQTKKLVSSFATLGSSNSGNGGSGSCSSGSGYFW